MTDPNIAPTQELNTVPTEEELIALRLLLATRPEALAPELLFMGGMALLSAAENALED